MTNRLDPAVAAAATLPQPPAGWNPTVAQLPMDFDPPRPPGPIDPSRLKGLPSFGGTVNDEVMFPLKPVLNDEVMFGSPRTGTFGSPGGLSPVSLAPLSGLSPRQQAMVGLAGQGGSDWLTQFMRQAF